MTGNPNEGTPAAFGPDGVPTHVWKDGVWLPLFLDEDGNDAHPENMPSVAPDTSELPEDYRLASDVEEKLIEWLIEQRLARGVITLIAGRPGQGKSMLTAWLTAFITQQGHRVIFSNLEDLEGETTRPRLRVAGADLSKVSFWTPDLTTAEGLAKLEAVVRTLQVKLLVLDPISGHMTRRQMDSRVSINPVRDLCQRTGLSIVAIHHTRKNLPKNAHPIDWVKGMGDGFLAAARMVYIFGRNADDPDERLLVHAKTNISAEGSMTFAFDLVETVIDGEDTEIGRLLLVDPLSEVSPTKIADDRPGRGGGDAGNDPTKRAVASEFVESVLMGAVSASNPSGRMHANELYKHAEDAQITRRTLRRAIEAVGCVKDEEHRGFGKGRDIYWRLPDGHPALKIAQKARGGLDEADLAKLAADHDLTVDDVLAAIDADKPDEGEADE